MTDGNRVLFFETLRRGDVPTVGGKNASLGEMVANMADAGVKVPPGFATTADAFREYIETNNLEETIRSELARVEDGRTTLPKAGEAIRAAILGGTWPQETADAIGGAYAELCRRAGWDNAAVAVRSSATAEDLPDASFAGQQETFLNVTGERDLLDACRRCYASLFTDRAISYRQAKGFDHMKVALSVGVQQMVRSDSGGSGVMFTIDTETGFDKVVLIDAAWGYGETVVQGLVDPDRAIVYKPLLAEAGMKPILEKTLGAKATKMIAAPRREGVATSALDRPIIQVPTSRAEREGFVLSDDDIVALARHAVAIEAHYGQPMDIEWAKDGPTGELYIVQARPETVQSRRAVGVVRSYSIGAKGRTLTTGLSVGDQVVTGRVCMIEDVKDIGKFVDGSVLVTSNTDPDWVPIMKRAVAIVTDHGGRTSHAAIVSRELGLPAIVGTGNATHVLHDMQEVTVSCAEGDEGAVYEGAAEVSVKETDVANVPATRTKVMVNLANPGAAFRWWQLPADGVGLARMEFVISNHIKIHPKALLNFETLKDKAAQEMIGILTRGIEDKPAYFVDLLARGLGRIAAAFHPKPVIVRMSDFKTNEYAGLIGGAEFEPDEENPMIGFRGASRYYSEAYRDAFALECRAISKLRNEMGFKNVIIMIPFCRSLGEADKVLQVLADNGLQRGQDGLQVYVMGEIPANAVLADRFAGKFDGFSIGSNDLTQLTLGVDRDSERLADLFDEQDEAVRWMIGELIARAHSGNAKVGLCGEAPSNHPEFARFLVGRGIDSISVNPDSFFAVKSVVAEAEEAGANQAAAQ